VAVAQKDVDGVFLFKYLANPEKIKIGVKHHFTTGRNNRYYTRLSWEIKIDE